MKVLHEINFASGLGADRWIVSGYRDAFVDLGHQFEYLTYEDSIEEGLKKYHPDVLMIGAGRINRQSVEVLEAAKKQGVIVFIWVDSMFEHSPELRELLTNRDPGNIYHGETEYEWMRRFVEITGKQYVVTANAANRKYHFPTVPVEKYRCDITFLGANLPMKKDAFARLLLPLGKKYKVRIYGPGWTVKDNAMRMIAALARKSGLGRLNDFISKKRISVPVDEENQLYSSAKVSLNIHEARTGAMQAHMILNERTFKIAACGGFEICDNVPPLRKYFAEDEVVMAQNDEDWFRKIEYYLQHDAEREAIRKRGSARALRDHLYHNRVEQLLEIIRQIGRVPTRNEKTSS